MLFVVSLALTVANLMLQKFEHANVYHPSREAESAVTDLRATGEDLFLQSSDGVKLHAWFLPAKEDSSRKDFVLIFCHGNGGNLTGRPSYYRALLESGINLLAFDYRGYGQSEGEPGEEGTYLDAFAAYDSLRARGFGADRIIVWGESLGGGIASKVAAEREVAALVLQSTFTSTPDVGAEWFKFLPVHMLATIHYDTRARLPDIHCPVVIMHSKVDEIIPFHHSEKNLAAANEPKVFVELEGGHNDSMYASPEKYRDGLRAALKLIDEQEAK
ncbi:MAG: alpha/beta hydrolase [Verrucomicrobiia bacterium]